MHPGRKLFAMLLISVLAVAGFAFAKVWPRFGSPVALSIRNYTNACAVVTLVNLTSEPLDYTVKVERKGSKGWPVYDNGYPVGIDSGQGGALAASSTTNLSLSVLTYAPPSPWRVSIFCVKGVQFTPSSFRFRAGFWCLRLHMRRLAGKVFDHAKVIRISGPQMEQL
jgi:hypothetical protein